MGSNVAQKLISTHLVSGQMVPGAEIGLRIDQTLTQDATGALVMLELEALGLDRARTEVSVHDAATVKRRGARAHSWLGNRRAEARATVMAAGGAPTPVG